MENLKFQYDFLDTEPDVPDCAAIGLATQVIIDHICHRYLQLMKCGCGHTCKPKAKEEADWLYTKPKHHEIVRQRTLYRRCNNGKVT